MLPNFTGLSQALWIQWITALAPGENSSQRDILGGVRLEAVWRALSWPSLAMQSGEVAPEDAKAKAEVRSLVTAHNRMFGRHNVSMDAETREGCHPSFGSLIADPSTFSVEGSGHRVLMPGW